MELFVEKLKVLTYKTLVRIVFPALSVAWESLVERYLKE